jgi:hypothetical protein
LSDFTVIHQAGETVLGTVTSLASAFELPITVIKVRTEYCGLV